MKHNLVLDPRSFSHTMASTIMTSYGGQQRGWGLPVRGRDLHAARHSMGNGGLKREQSVHSCSAGYCEEQEWIDLSTVKGYCRTVMCQGVRDELKANLPQLDCGPKGHEDKQNEEEEEWQRTLIGMCDGRLLPTPWLNQVGTVRMPTASHTYVCTDECILPPWHAFASRCKTSCQGCHVCLCLSPSKFAEAVICCIGIKLRNSQPFKQRLSSRQQSVVFCL